jgi:hypothetical protein
VGIAAKDLSAFNCNPFEYMDRAALTKLCDRKSASNLDQEHTNEPYTTLRSSALAPTPAAYIKRSRLFHDTWCSSALARYEDRFIDRLGGHFITYDFGEICGHGGQQQIGECAGVIVIAVT